MLVDIVLTTVVVVFVAVALLGHVLVLTAMLHRPQDQARRAAAARAIPSKRRVGVTAG
jgi:hypothetical protein